MQEISKNFQGAKIIEVIEVWTLEGNGTQDNPYKRIRTILDKDGFILGSEMEGELKRIR